MLLSLSDILDLFLRFFAVGQLLLLTSYVLCKKHNVTSVLATMVLACLSSYVLLTAPIANHHYGVLRGIFLLFTEFLPFVLWGYAGAIINDNFQPAKWHISIKLALLITLLWFVYFFGVMAGRGVFHDITHTIQLVVLLHIIYIAVNNIADDLVSARRNARVLLVIFASLYMVMLVVLELTDASVRDNKIFSLTSIMAIIVSINLISWALFSNKFKDETGIQVTSNSLSDNKAENKTDNPTATDKNNDEHEESIELPAAYQSTYQHLSQLMTEQVYKEPELTIRVLAEKLATPEHQLRALINKHLGFRNFSAYINSYRLPAACNALADIAQIRKPILTIALELGFGSIATFNRAFKTETGKTPKEYRAQFQK